MQAVLTNGSILEINNIKSRLTSLFQELEGADNSQKSMIENEIVSFGADAIDFLINKLTDSKGVQRGISAMSLIRIGEAAISPLKNLSDSNKNFSWVANYIIQEITGTI